MIETFIQNKDAILKAFIETNLMMIISIVLSLIISIPLGTLLYALNRDFLIKNKVLYQIFSFLLNTLRSIPFLLFIFILIPVNRAIWKTSYGVISSIIPLTLVTVSIYTRFVEQAYININQNIIDRAISMGANKFQIIRYFLFPSITNDLVLSFTSTVISILSYSTVMGVIGAGGLGDYAFRYGYQEYNYQLMYLVILIFILYVFIIQSIGYFIAKKLNKFKGR
ncbi:methionine ABC transporter permease [Helcococcus kunzii]|uniref:methionine ABC transporter permease n=1 Tax=Helcococcus kunzii TaxID=40091 RepID=UPI0024ACF069|nr:ABC transporter permease subunit [Helcococcus kunzii]